MREPTIQEVMRQGLPAIKLKLKIMDKLVYDLREAGVCSKNAEVVRSLLVNAETKLRRKAMKVNGLHPVAQRVAMKTTRVSGRVLRPE